MEATEVNDNPTENDEPTTDEVVKSVFREMIGNIFFDIIKREKNIGGDELENDDGIEVKKLFEGTILEGEILEEEQLIEYPKKWKRNVCCEIRLEAIENEQKKEDEEERKKIYEELCDIKPTTVKDLCKKSEVQSDKKKDCQKLKEALTVKKYPFSLQTFCTKFPQFVKFHMRSGKLHINMCQFPVMSRGRQGTAVAIAAIATSCLIKPNCWNQCIIDQIIKDGDKFYCQSYEVSDVECPEYFTISNLLDQITVRKSHVAKICINDSCLEGFFFPPVEDENNISDCLKDFFNTQNCCVLSSSILNVAIWYDDKKYYLFDGQARNKSGDVVKCKGSAKLMILNNLNEVLYVILAKSGVKSELFSISSVCINSIQFINDVSKEKSNGLVRGSYHLETSQIWEPFKYRAHLVLAIVAVVYSTIIHSKNWKTNHLNLIFDQSNIFLMDIVRFLKTSCDKEELDIKIDSLPTNVPLGIYTAKIMVEKNVICSSDTTEEDEVSLEDNVGIFFKTNCSGIIEIQEIYYAIWKQKDRYYLFDPFPCDKSGCRVEMDDKEYEKATCCLFSSSSVKELAEMIIYNNRTFAEESFVIHGICILDIQIDNQDNSYDDVFSDKIIQISDLLIEDDFVVEEEDKIEINNLLRVTHITVEAKKLLKKCPSIIKDLEVFIVSEGTLDPESRFGETYDIATNEMATLSGSYNCCSTTFSEKTRGQQQDFIPVVALAASKLKDPTEWISSDVDEIVTLGTQIWEEHKAHQTKDETKLDAEAKKLFDEILEEHGIEKDTGNEDSKNLDLPDTIRLHDYEVSLQFLPKLNSNSFGFNDSQLKFYFEMYYDIVLNCGDKSYAIWRQNGNYYFFNPYGSSCKRDDNNPATVTVMNSLLEFEKFVSGFIAENDYDLSIVSMDFLLLNSKNGRSDLRRESRISKNSSIILKGNLVDPESSSILMNFPNNILNSTSLRSGSKNSSKILKGRQIVLKDSVIDSENDSRILKKTHNVSEERTSNFKNGINHINSNNFSNDISKEIINTRKCSANSSNNFTRLRNSYNDSKNNSSIFNKAFVNGSMKISVCTTEKDESISSCCLDDKERESNKIKKIEEDIKMMIKFYDKLQNSNEFTLFLICMDTLEDSTQSNKENVLGITKCSAPRKRILCILEEAKKLSSTINSLTSSCPDDKQSEEDDCPTVPWQNQDDLKMMKLPPNIYFYSKTSPIGSTLVKVIEGSFIRGNEKKEREKFVDWKHLEEFENILINEIVPVLVPLGCVIKTPVPKPCDRKKKITEKRKLHPVCDKDDIIFNMLFQMEDKEKEEKNTDHKKNEPVQIENNDVTESSPAPEEEKQKIDLIEEEAFSSKGFESTANGSVCILRGKTKLESRNLFKECYYKPCFFSSIICILFKSLLDSHSILSFCVLDECISLAEKYFQQCKKLKYKDYRKFYNIVMEDMKFDIVVENILESEPSDLKTLTAELKDMLNLLMENSQSAILVFDNIAYATWYNADNYYLFDSYGCDKDGFANDSGNCALTAHGDQKSVVDRILKNTGESSLKSYRLYEITISHLSPITECTTKSKRICIEDKSNSKVTEKSAESNEDYLSESSESTSCEGEGFSALPNYRALSMDAPIFNDVNPELLPSIQLLQKEKSCIGLDKFIQDLEIPVDICIVAWSRVEDPLKWNTETIQNLYEAGKHYSPSFSDIGMKEELPKLNIDEFWFNVSLKKGSVEDFPHLKSSLDKAFVKYSGVTVYAGDFHVGTMKKDSRYYIWWEPEETKNIRMVTSDSLEELLKILFNDKKINEGSKVKVNPIVIKVEKQKQDQLFDKSYNLQTIFCPTVSTTCPIFVQGTTCFKNRHSIKEPKIKKCYFAAILAVLLKRDIVQNLSEGILDKILELSTNLFKKFNSPIYYSHTILHNIPIFNRIFDFQDISFQLVKFQTKDDFVHMVTNHLKKFLEIHSSGIVQFTNCCYGFWYSSIYRNYYYFDPYGCNKCGKKDGKKGKSCLGIFSNLNKMVTHMKQNQAQGTTGFYIRRLHVDSINLRQSRGLLEDPMWTYLDYHWKYNKSITKPCKKMKIMKPTCYNYTIEIPNLLYSLWGSIGTYDTKFCELAGCNKAAICVVSLLFRNLVNEENFSSRFLDFMVCQGHKYYLQSQKKKWKNRLGLAPCFSIRTYFSWKLKFEPTISGKLYESSNKSSLLSTLKRWISDNSDIKTAVLECGKVTLALLKTEHFYIINPCCVGLPVFPKGRGGIYVLRCANFNLFAYCIIKSLNTNRMHPFHLTPLTYDLHSYEEYDGYSCLEIDNMLTATPKLVRPADCCKSRNSEVVTRQGSDNLECFERNLSLGLFKIEKAKEMIGEETCSLKDYVIPDCLERIKYHFPRLIDFFEGLVLQERICLELKVESKEQKDSTSDQDLFKIYSKKIKKKLYEKYIHQEKEGEMDTEEIDDSLGTVGQSNVEEIADLSEFEEGVLDFGLDYETEDIIENENDE